MKRRRKAREVDPDRSVFRLRGRPECAEPVLRFWHQGPLTYLWIGDNKGSYYGTLSGPKTLARLARTLLREVLPPKKRRKK